MRTNAAAYAAAINPAWTARRTASFVLFSCVILWAPLYLAARLLLGYPRLSEFT